MENAFRAERTMMLDHIHCRSATCEDIEDEQSLLGQRHESFTNEILASLQAKVVILYGVKLQRRVLKTRQLTFLPLWGAYEGVLVALDHESNYRESDSRYKFRRAFLFSGHPNHLMYQQKGSSVLKRHDLITEAAAGMAGENQLVRANFYREKLWKRDDPRRLAAFAEAGKRGAQLSPYPFSTMVSSSSNSRPDDAVPLTWDNIWDEQPIHNNRVLADEILPATLAVWSGKRSGQRLDWHKLSDLPLPILRWLQGSRYALFGSVPVPESEDSIISMLCELAFEAQPVQRPPLQRILQGLVENQARCVKSVGEKPHSDRLHSGVGQTLVISCPTCAWESTDKNPRWAVTPPGHYYCRQHICKSEVCKGGRKGFYPKDWSILRTPDRVALEKEGFDQYYALRSFLRTKDESSGLADTVESWCVICKEGTKISKGRTVVVDYNPQYTLGKIPLYLEKRNDSLLCLEVGRKSSRFVPKENIPSVIPVLVWNIARCIVDLDRSIKGFVMDSVLRASDRTYRFDKG